MHSIKRQAHRSAWADDGANYNPFRRYRSNSPSRDIEQGIQHPATFPAESSTKLNNRPPVRTHRSEPVATQEKDFQNVSPTTATAPLEDKIVPEDEAPSDRTLQGADGDAEGLKNRHPIGPKAIQEEDRSPTEQSEYNEEEEKKRRRHEMLKKHIPIGTQIRATLIPSWFTINWLLVAAPIGIGLHFVKGLNPIAVFVVNFIAIIPLAGILSFATEEIAMRVGETVGGLLNATFGNAVELIVSIIALTKGQIIIVQTSLIGSMLSNLLIVLGMCFFFGGLNRIEQHFNATVAQTATSLLALSVGSLLIPTAFSSWSTAIDADKTNRDEEISYGTAIILLVVYGSYLFFQLKSHAVIYNTPSQKAEKRRKSTKKEEGDTFKALAAIGGQGAAASGGKANKDSHVRVPDEDGEEPTLSLIGSLCVLAASTALIGVCSEFLLDSLDGLTCETGVSEYFVGLILLPIVGNAAEHATAVTVAIKDKMDLAIGVAVGSSMQIALLVLPLSVIIGWIIGQDMRLVFDSFQIVVLFVAVIIVNYLIGDAKSHWLEGFILIALYVIIATVSWFYPSTPCNAE